MKLCYDLKVDIQCFVFQMMEYREVLVSFGVFSVYSLDNGGMDNLGFFIIFFLLIFVFLVEIVDERLLNELLDEICEDIGMKEGMELDFVEFLMEQDMVDF